MLNYDNLITAIRESQENLSDEELTPFLKNLNTVLGNKGKKLLITDQDPKKQFPLKLQRFMGVQMSFEKIMLDKELTGADRRVLDYFLTYMDQKNILKHNQTDIGNKLGMKQPHVSKSIKKLKDKNIIQYKGSKRGGHYIVNPELAWKGRTDDWYDLIEIAKLMKQNTIFMDDKDNSNTAKQEWKPLCPSLQIKKEKELKKSCPF